MRVRGSMAAWACVALAVGGWVRPAEAVPPRVRWERDLGEGALRTPTWREGVLYVGGPISSRELFALDARSGAVVWRRRLSDRGPTSAVTVRDRLVLGSESCHVHVLDATTGELVWERWLGQYVTATPVAADGRVFAVHTDRAAWALSALSLDAGRPLWKRPLPRNVLDAVVAAGDALMVTTDDGRVWRFDARTGALVWRHDVDALGAPIVHGDTVQVVTWPRDATGFVSVRIDLRFPERDRVRVRRIGGLDPWLEGLRSCEWEGLGEVALLPSGTVRWIEGEGGAVRACVERTVGATIRAAPRSVRPTAAWTLKIDRGTQWITVLDAATGAILREATERALGGVPRPTERMRIQEQWHYEGQRAAIAAGHAYEIVGSFLQRRALTDDTVIWSVPLGQRVTLPALAGDVVTYGTESGAVVARDATSGRELWTVDVGHSVASQPIAAEGWVWVTTNDGRVVAIETGTPMSTAWPMWGGDATHRGTVATGRSARSGISETPWQTETSSGT